jgi:hypothetical protein
VLKPRAWHKSSFSENLNCLEMALTDTQVLIRDSYRTPGAVLTFTPAPWQHFIGHLTCRPPVCNGGGSLP